jgi:hypothetical protein
MIQVKFVHYRAILLLILFPFMSASARTLRALLISDSGVATDCKRGVKKWGGLNGKSYQQDAIRTYKDWQYVSYYTSSAPRRLVLARRSLSSPNSKWEKIVFEDYEQVAEDDHAIHIAYDHHADPLHYLREAKDFGSAPQYGRYRLQKTGILSVFMVKRNVDHLHVLDYRLPFGRSK